MQSKAQDLLAEWFGDSRDDPGRASSQHSLWFRASEQQDQRLRERYGDLVETALAGGLLDWQDDPRRRLALILLLDQLPRNIHRGIPRAFSGDARAASLALAGIAAGMDRGLSPVEQAFFYMPLQHAEDRAAQRYSVGQFRALAQRNPEYSDLFGGFLKFAEEHSEIVERFGRFPHRNLILGRESTPEEEAFLEGGGPRYGQG